MNHTATIRPPIHEDGLPGSEATLAPQPDWQPRYPGSGRLKGKIALITGADSGIGRATAVLFAREGAKVAIAYLCEDEDAAKTRELCEAEGAQTVIFSGDLGDPEVAHALVDLVICEWGQLDILVNNAGIFPNLKFDDMSFEQWRQVLAVNLDSLFLMTKAILPLMKPQGWGRIVNIVSGSPWLSITGITHYASSKMGGVGFTRGLANDVAEYGITVNAIAPTASRTPGALLGINEEILGMVAQAQAIKKIGEAEDIVGTVLFLTSDDSYFVTAQTIMADGGLNRL
ncbi:MAG: short-chain dehydrogenase [Sphingomonadales bacterium 39-62-4]|nr:MAG: short-chain dehydrogenase [Sphingomonadales bacterium 39-62-4]